MKSLIQQFNSRVSICLAVVLVLGACATTEDVRRASNLIRLDNELTRTLENQTLDNSQKSKAMLAIIATDAQNQANKKENDYDTIAFYRVAAIARWQQQDDTSYTDLISNVDAGLKICTSLGDKKPDRDCFILKLVLPFSAIELTAAGIDTYLDGIDFTDSDNTDNEVKALNQAVDEIESYYSLINRIYSIGGDDKNMLHDHAALINYYCTESNRLWNLYSARWGSVGQKVAQFETQNPVTTESIDFTLARIRDLDPKGLENEHDTVLKMCSGM